MLYSYLVVSFWLLWAGGRAMLLPMIIAGTITALDGGLSVHAGHRRRGAARIALESICTAAAAAGVPSRRSGVPEGLADLSPRR